MKSDKGFAIIVVIWIVGLVATAAGVFSLATNSSINVVSSETESVLAEALADAAAELAIQDLVSATDARSQTANGSEYLCDFGEHGRALVVIQDEAGLVDINKAGVPLLEALVAGTGQPDMAASIAAEIFDYRDLDEEPRPDGAETDGYAAAGLGWGPKNAPFTAVDEMLRMPAMSAQILERIRPFVTVHSQQAGIDPNVTPPALLAALRRGVEGSAAALRSFPEIDAALGVPRIFTEPSRQRVFSIVVRAEIPGGARFVREAVVDIGSRRERRAQLLRWRQKNSLPGSRQDGPGRTC